MERREFQRILICLRAGVDEKQLIVIIARHLSEHLGKPLLERIDYRVGVKHEPRSLLVDSLDHYGMAMSHRYYGMTSIQVEVFGAVVVVDMASPAFYYLYVEKRIYVK